MLVDDSHLYHAIELYRNNLVACSKRYNLLFIAASSKIKVYKPSYPTQCVSNPFMTLHGPEELSHLRSRGYINNVVPHTINNMIIADLGTEEILLVANDNGYVTLWYTRHLVQREGNMDIWFDVKQSAWGLAVHKTKRLIAISANTTFVSVYEMGNEAIDPDRPPRGAGDPITLAASYQNLPSVSFLQEDAAGRWLVTTDIVGNVICYDLLKGSETRTSYRGQGWTVSFVSERDFLWVEREEFEGVVEKARVDSIKSARQGLLSFAAREDEDEEGEDFQDDWASDVQMTLYGGGDSDEELEDDSDDETYEAEEDGDGQDDDADMSDEFDEEVEMNFTALEEAILPHTSESIDDAYEMDGPPLTPTFTEDQQTAAYGPVPASPSYTPSLTTDGTPLLTPDEEEDDDPPWEYPPPSFIIHSKEFDLKLLGMQDPPKATPFRNEHIVSLVTLRHLIPPDSITVAARTSQFPLRMNMSAYIPALSLYVVGRQDGRVALVRLLRTNPSKTEEVSETEKTNGNESSWTSKKRDHRHFLHLEHIIPSEKDLHIPFALAGICVAPVQGWEDRDPTKGMDEGKEWLQSSSDVGGRWRIFMLYTDGSVVCYTVASSVGVCEDGCGLLI
ncbi:hypothetical protein AA313_de0201076 [Arthrobotrys entomopaga]|nr:hypothetical protein AA313_de0201076 [Arthrobotrys entomopaga]